MLLLQACYNGLPTLYVWRNADLVRGCSEKADVNIVQIEMTNMSGTE